MVGLPFFVHFGLSTLGPAVFAVILFIAFVSRIVAMSAVNKGLKVGLLGLVCLYCGLIAVYENGALLLFYPALMSSLIALMFLLSLFADRTLIEQMVRLSGKSFPPEALMYMRGLTKAWVVLLSLNALIAGYSACCQSNEFWLLYNGVIAYLIIAFFILIEWLYRGRYMRKYPPALSGSELDQNGHQL